MIVGDFQVACEIIDAIKLNLDSLEDKDELVGNDSEEDDRNSEVIGNLVLKGGDVLDLVERVSLDAPLKLASDSSSNFHFLIHQNCTQII